MQTAVVVFGGDNQKNGMCASPLMLENVKNDHATVSSLNSPPFLTQELCRERLVSPYFGDDRLLLCFCTEKFKMSES